MLLLLSGSAALAKYNQDRDIAKASETKPTSRFKSNLLALNLFLIVVGRMVILLLFIFIAVSISVPNNPDHFKHRSPICNLDRCAPVRPSDSRLEAFHHRRFWQCDLKQTR